MVAISATSSVTPSLQVALGKTRLEQARREATQAEATAQSLRAQANDAERDAQKSQEKVRELAAKSQLPDLTYAPPRKGLTAEVQTATKALLAELNKSANRKHAEVSPARNATVTAPPVLNTQGQTTGRIVNLIV
jgi:type II secretory pathway pseudopilin PulG